MRTSRGFSLIEIIVSIFIVGVMLFVSQAILFGAPIVKNAKDQDLALKIAGNEIEGLRALGYASLPSSGSFSDSMLASLTSGSGNIIISDFNTGTKKVVATVSWTEKGTTKSISLSTLITKIGGLP